VANLFREGGYSVERFDSGMLAYLCELYNEGTREPLASFMGHLGLNLAGGRLRPALEWNGIDLVIHRVDDHDPSKENPLVAFEMKVDSVEGKVKGEWQTIYYPKLLPDCTPFRYVTLGTSEIHRAPRGEDNPSVSWVRIGKFLEALKVIQTSDPLIEQWRAAIEDEADLQERSFSDGTSRLGDYRGKKGWSVYFLGNLKSKLVTELQDRNLGVEPTVYTYGQAPDTILNFGRGKLPAYLEVNNNGRLNLKVKSDDLDSQEEKNKRFREVQEHYRELMAELDPRLSNKKSFKKTATVMSFDVGLVNEEGNLFYASTEKETIGRLVRASEVFYGGTRPSFE
jgi:hypothetical protein